MLERFCKNSWQLKAVNYFCKNVYHKCLKSPQYASAVLEQNIVLTWVFCVDLNQEKDEKSGCSSAKVALLLLQRGIHMFETVYSGFEQSTFAKCIYQQYAQISNIARMQNDSSWLKTFISIFSGICGKTYPTPKYKYHLIKAMAVIILTKTK